MTDLGYAAAGTLVERLGEAIRMADGDALVDLHAGDAEVTVDPFRPPLVGSNDLRAWLLHASESAEQVELVFERHWVVAPTILAAWHASYVHRATRARVRLAGFATLEVHGDGRIARARYWHNRAETPAG